MRVGLAIGMSLFFAASAAHADEQATVHASFHAFKGRPARIYAETTGERWALVCAAPCEADLHPGTHLRAVYDANEDEPHDFVIEGGAGTRSDVEIRPASKGPLAGGIVMTSIGGVTLLVGVVLLAVSSSLKPSSDFQTAGLVTSVVGGGLTIGGILLIANRSHEPRIRQDTNVRYDKGNESLLVPPAITPLGWTFTF